MDTKKTSVADEETLSKPNIVFANLVVVAVFLLVVGAVYYKVSKKSKGSQVFPAGVNYLSPKNATKAKPLYDFAKLAAAKDWVTFKGKLFSYSFQHPKELKPFTYPNDKSDAVAFKVTELPPEQSLLLTVETISERDKTLVGKPKDFVSNYWKFFSGLKGLKKITEVTNEKGLKGYMASYVVKGTNAVTSDFYFFIIDDEDDKLLHLGNTFPTEGQAVFKRILSSLEYQK